MTTRISLIYQYAFNESDCRYVGCEPFRHIDELCVDMQRKCHPGQRFYGKACIINYFEKCNFGARVFLHKTPSDIAYVDTDFITIFIGKAGEESFIKVSVGNEFIEINCRAVRTIIPQKTIQPKFVTMDKIGDGFGCKSWPCFDNVPLSFQMNWLKNSFTELEN